MAVVSEMHKYLKVAMDAVKDLLVLKEWLLPGKPRKDILQQLSTQIDQVRGDIQGLEAMLKAELAELKNTEVVEGIKVGMQYCLAIEKGSGKAEMMYHDKLKELCDKKFTVALSALMSGITGDAPIRKSILDDSYDSTKGDRPKVSALAMRLQQLVCGGVIVLATYNTIVYGEVGAKETAKQFAGRLKDVDTKVNSVIRSCVDNFRKNMLYDLNKKLEKGGSNAGLVTEVSDLMRDKYDWLENFCLVSDDLLGPYKHCIGRNHVDSVHANGKRGIVFYREKDEPPMFSDRYDEAKKIVDEVYKNDNNFRNSNAEGHYKSIVAKIEERGIGWTGCAVMPGDTDLKSHGTFSTKDVRINQNELLRFGSGREAMYMRFTAVAILLLK